MCVCVTQKNRVAAHNKRLCMNVQAACLKANVTTFSGETEESQINARYYNRSSIRNSN